MANTVSNTVATPVVAKPKAESALKRVAEFVEREISAIEHDVESLVERKPAVKTAPVAANVAVAPVKASN